MMVNKDGDPIIAGTLISGSNANPAREVFTTKLTGREGTVIWDKRFVDTLSTNIWVEDLTLDQSGDVVLLGSIQLTPTNVSALVVKYNGTNGAVRWERRIGTNEWYSIHTMALTESVTSFL